MGLGDEGGVLTLVGRDLATGVPIWRRAVGSARDVSRMFCGRVGGTVFVDNALEGFRDTTGETVFRVDDVEIWGGQRPHFTGDRAVMVGRPVADGDLGAIVLQVRACSSPERTASR